MGDEQGTGHSRSRPHTSGGSSTSPPTIPKKIARFWALMQGTFGVRWTTSYGLEPSEVWISALSNLTAAELTAAQRQILTSGVEHPPTLTQVLAYAMVGTGKKLSRFPDPGSPAWLEARKGVMAGVSKQSEARGMVWTESQRRKSSAALLVIDEPPALPELSRSETAVGRWFVYHATRFRFVGMAPTDVLHLRSQCIAACELVLPHLQAGDPDVTQADITRQLDRIAEELYPSHLAAAWLSNASGSVKRGTSAARP
jgi:hypothetical protein